MDQCLCECARLHGKAALFLICIKFNLSAQLSSETHLSPFSVPFSQEVSKLGAERFLKFLNR